RRLGDLKQAVVAIAVVARVARVARKIDLRRQRPALRRLDLHVEMRGAVHHARLAVRVGEGCVVLARSDGQVLEAPVRIAQLVASQAVAKDVVAALAVRLPDVDPRALNGLAADVDDLATEDERIAGHAGLADVLARW